MVFDEVKGEITKEKLYDHKKDAKYQNEDEFIAPQYDQLDDTEKVRVDNIINRMLGKENV